MIKGLKNKLIQIQSELKAPKGQFNSFGKYNYRSCEDILEAVKPLLAKYKVVMTITDEVVAVSDRVYVRACATLSDAEGDESVSNVAWAREDADKKGMDGSQLTGTASSYARKYCLNGLFLIDDTKDADTKDADTDEHRAEMQSKGAQSENKKAEKGITQAQMEMLMKIASERGQELDVEAIKGWSMTKASEIIAKYKGEKNG